MADSAAKQQDQRPINRSKDPGDDTSPSTNPSHRLNHQLSPAPILPNLQADLPCTVFGHSDLPTFSDGQSLKTFSKTRILAESKRGKTSAVSDAPAVRKLAV
ncbi:MAG: hypothetical protein K2Z81_23250, partial [Cyanobacteria bacterium]|nr:hypothetical protein [Cyanobacteriota bacterium]